MSSFPKELCIPIRSPLNENDTEKQTYGCRQTNPDICGYADKPIPHQELEYQNHITDVLVNAFNSNDKKATPIQQLSMEYNFESCKGIEVCQLVTVIAEFVAIYGNKNIDKSYGSPGGYDGEIIETMEDLFLLALFEIYTNCVL